MCQPREGLLSGIRMDRAQAPHVPRIEGLQQVERFWAANLAYKNSIGTVSERCAKQIGDGHRRQRCFLAKRDLRATCLEANEVWLVNQDFRRLLDEHNPV